MSKLYILFITFIFQTTTGLTALPASACLLLYLVLATYDALTVRTTAFIKFLAAWIKEVAESKPETISSPDTFWTSAFTWNEPTEAQTKAIFAQDKVFTFDVILSW